MNRLVVLISGGGSNLQALLDACAGGDLPARVVLVVSNRPEAYGLERARRAGVRTLCLPWDRKRRREEYDRELAGRVGEVRPDLVVLAGWMHILSPVFLDRFPGRVINLHPALPGEFPGTDAIRRAYEAWRRGEIERSGCTVHHAVPEVDAGPPVVTAVVPFREGDTLERFEARMHRAEHRLLVEAVGRLLRVASRDPGHRPSGPGGCYTGSCDRVRSAGAPDRDPEGAEPAAPENP